MEKTTMPIKIIRTAETILITAGAILLFALMVFGAGDVIGRYFFNRPIHGTLEISKLFVMGMVVFYWAYTQKHKGHVSITFVIDRFPPKLRQVTDMLIGLASLFIFTLFTWQSYKVAIVNWEAKAVTELGFPIFIMHLIVCLSALVMCIELIIQLVTLVLRKTPGLPIQNTQASELIK
jgi:TRAP-type transport system small permease protein